MSFSTDNKFTTASTNGCLMDSDLPSLDGSPSDTLSDSWIPKEFTGATFSGTGFSSCSGKITYIPVQVASTKDTSIDAVGYYIGKFSGSIGGFGQTDHVVKLTGLCGGEQYVFLKSVTVQCGVDDQGHAVHACLNTTDGKMKSSEVKFRSINTDADSAQQTRSFWVFITVTAEISNTDFGIGQLFPNK